MQHLYIGIIVPASILIPIGIVSIKYKTCPFEIKLLFFYLLVSVVIYLLSTIMAVYHIENIFIIHIDTIIESIFFLQFFYIILHHKKIKKWIKLFQIIFPVFCCCNIIFIQGFYRYNTYSRPVEACIFMGLSMYYWWQSGNGTVRPWKQIPTNWIVSGMLIYFSGSFLLFISSNFIVTNYDVASNILVWNIHATFILVMYLLFSIGFSKCKI